MAAQEPGVCLWALGPWNMANSPWEIKITSFGESLLLSPSTHTQAVPKSPFSLSPPLTSPGNHQPSRTISMLYWAGSQLVLQRVALHMQPLYRNTCPSKHLPATCELVRIFQQTTSTDKNISTVPVKEGWVPAPFTTWIKVWGKGSIWYILLPWWPLPLEGQVISVCWQNDL